jgi:hypothetical protein
MSKVVRGLQSRASDKLKAPCKHCSEHILKKNLNRHELTCKAKKLNVQSDSQTKIPVYFQRTRGK